MACATCGHTMELVQQDTDGRPTRWCPRCGSLTVGAGMPAVPKLVERCRQFYTRMTEGDRMDGVSSVIIDADWHTLGIAESISPPPERLPL
jgi:DNA-directed RNA polymerase subunit RPC12/RpoP